MRGMRHAGLPNWAVGLIVAIVMAILALYAFTKTIPFLGNPYEVEVIFSSGSNVRVTAPVRIAGVNVGEVTEVTPLAGSGENLQAAANGLPSGSSAQQGAIVTMEIKDEGRPLKEDATFKLRPRLFLEGNMFVQLRPGSPNAPEAEEGYTFPASQTSYAVQLDQVLSTLQSDVREDLQIFLDEFGDALIKHGGAEGFRELYRSGGGAFRYTSQVNEALLGTSPHDLSGLVKDLDSTVRALGQNETALKDLVTNLRVFTGAFAAEDASLQRAISELPRVIDAGRPAFAKLNAAFPSLRAFAREALPGTRSTVPALDAANPFIDQLRKLMRPSELRGLVAGLRPTIPDLARLTKRSLPFLDESRALGSCFNEVLNPFQNDTVDPAPGYAHPPEGRVFEELGYSLVGVASESRSGDANGQTTKVQAGGGFNTVIIPGADPFTGGPTLGLTPFNILGAMPKIDDSAKTPFSPGEPCEEQEPPDLGAGLGSGPASQTPIGPVPLSATDTSGSASDVALPQPTEEALAQIRNLADSYKRVGALREDGRRGDARRLEARLAEDYARIARRHRRAVLSLGGGE